MTQLVRPEVPCRIQEPARHELILDVAEFHHARGIPGVGGNQEPSELIGEQRKNRRNAGVPLLQQIREKSGGRVEAPLGAVPVAIVPSASRTSASTVGFPLESNTSLPITF